MKKIFFALICAAAVGFAACQKQEVPGAEPAAPLDGLRTVTLNAGMPGSKVAVATSGKVTWTTGDKIAVYNTEGTKFELSLTDGADTDYGTFSGEVSGTLDDLAVYPASFAGDTKGTIVIPRYIARTDDIPLLMASSLAADETGSVILTEELRFRHLAAVMEFTLQDVPAYACAFKAWSSSGTLSGTFAIDDTLDGLTPVEGTTATDCIVYFPYKTAYGPDATVKFYFPVPAREYTDYKVRVLDGDETVIEGTDLLVPAASSKLAAGDYVAMKTINVRSKVGTARDKFVKVEGVKWAKGNLRAWAGGIDGDGWQPDWNIYANQWESQIVTDPASAAETVTVNGNKVNFTFNKNSNGAYFHWDYFSWGTLGRASRVHNQKLKSTKEEFSISGKVFRSGTMGTTDYYDVSEMTEVTGDDRFAANVLIGSSNPTIVGDLAFWASKGQYRLPTAEENRLLYNKKGEDKRNANMKVGYYMLGQQKIRGVLFTSSPSWANATYDSTPENEFTAADIESGLFLPRAGVRRDNNATSIIHFNNFGSYWSGTYGGSKEETKARAIAWAQAEVTNNCDMMNGYSINYNNNVFFGSTPTGNCIRPVYIDPVQ